MTKYAIIIGENNEELSCKVQEALFKVGFKWACGDTVINQDKKILCLNTLGDPMIVWTSKTNSSYDMIWPSYVIKNAHLLDGAKKPWEIPPEGYRLVTDEERVKYDKPSDGLFFSKGNERWKINGRGWWIRENHYAVPVDFTFETEHDKKVKDLEGKIHTLTTELAELKQGEK